MPPSQYISSITIVLSHVNWEWRPITFVILAVAGKKKIPHLAGFRELPRNQRGNPKSQAPNPRQIPICKSEIQNELAKARINLATTFTDYRRGGARHRPTEIPNCKGQMSNKIQIPKSKLQTDDKAKQESGVRGAVLCLLADNEIKSGRLSHGRVLYQSDIWPLHTSTNFHTCWWDLIGKVKIMHLDRRR